MTIPPPPPNRRRTNQAGNEIVEEDLFNFFGGYETEVDIREAIVLILQHLNKKIVRTNATKHGNTETVLRDVI